MRERRQARMCRARLLSLVKLWSRVGLLWARHWLGDMRQNKVRIDGTFS